MMVWDMVFRLNVSLLLIFPHPVEADVDLVLDLDHVEPLPHSQLPLVGVVISTDKCSEDCLVTMQHRHQ